MNVYEKKNGFQEYNPILCCTYVDLECVEEWKSLLVNGVAKNEKRR